MWCRKFSVEKTSLGPTHGSRKLFIPEKAWASLWEWTKMTRRGHWERVARSNTTQSTSHPGDKELKSESKSMYCFLHWESLSVNSVSWTALWHHWFTFWCKLLILSWTWFGRMGSWSMNQTLNGIGGITDILDQLLQTALCCGLPCVSCV